MEERILEILKLAKSNSLSKEEVFKKLAFTNLSFDDFEEVFDDMKDRHLIYQNGKDSYQRNPFFEGEVKVSRNGDLYVKTDIGKVLIPDVVSHFVSGDMVQVKITNFNEMIGTIRSVVDRKKLAGIVFTDKGTRCVELKNGTSYKIDLDDSIVDGMVVGIKIDIDSKNKPIAILDKVIGHKDSPRFDDEIILYENNFSYEWPEEVEKEITKVPSSIDENDIKGRRDLREECIFTIDGDDTKDIDDAISLKVLDNGNYLLGVHIADVSNYVKEGSAIDLEAYSRATSVYMNTVVNPMYPRVLSNGICSLNPDVDRLAMSCEMEIDKNGKIISFDVFESVIHSRKQMTYKAVNSILEEDTIPEGYSLYKDTLCKMNELANILKKMRVKRGYQEFDRPEIKVVTDENGIPTEITSRSQRSGEELIEQFMLAANECIATYIYSMGVPSVYRDHDKPDEERLKQVVTVIRNYGDEVEINGKFGSPKYVQDLLTRVKETKRKTVYSNLIMRCLAKATYEAYNIGHFSVGINPMKKEAYTHFTSPIRRYPDTTVHRTLKGILHGNINTLCDDNNKRKMVEIAKHSSVQERNADKCEKESNKMKTAQYMENYIGEEYEGEIVTFTTSGMYVQLPNLIEGRVSYESLDDYYSYDPIGEVIVGEKSHNVYRLGDKVNVMVVRADKNAREIDFEITKSKSKIRKA